MLAQVLDDSTKQEVREKVDASVAELVEQGHPVQVRGSRCRSGIADVGLGRREGMAAPLHSKPSLLLQVLRRTNRGGYKAGAMVVGLETINGQGYE